MDSIQGAAIIRGLPNDDNDRSLIELCRALGDAAVGDRVIPGARLSSRFVSSVTPKEDAMVDKDGLKILSSTSDDFHLHTDCSYLATPPELLLMHCVQRPTSGGDSTLLSVDDLALDLDASLLSALQKNRFPFRFGEAPILSERGRLKIRFNRDQILLGIRKKKQVESHLVPLLDTLRRIISDSGKIKHVRLHPTDCIVIDNERVLHGRTAFPRGAKRLLKRLRIFSTRSHGKNNVQGEW